MKAHVAGALGAAVGLLSAAAAAAVLVFDVVPHDRVPARIIEWQVDAETGVGHFGRVVDTSFWAHWVLEVQAPGQDVPFCSHASPRPYLFSPREPRCRRWAAEKLFGADCAAPFPRGSIASVLVEPIDHRLAAVSAETVVGALPPAPVSPECAMQEQP